MQIVSRDPPTLDAEAMADAIARAHRSGAVPIGVGPSYLNTIWQLCEQQNLIRRSQGGLADLQIHGPITWQIATPFAAELAARRVVAHDRASGPQFAQLVYAVCGPVAAAENAAAGPSDPAVIIQLWLDSPPHRANMLGPYNRIGAGFRVGTDGLTYWDCVYARL